MTSLAERVQAILDIESGTGYLNPFDCVWEEPGGPRGKNMTTFEMDLRDWGMTFGLAYGIARGEDPYESNESVAQRALDAARMVWKGWDQDPWVWGEEPEVAAS